MDGDLRAPIRKSDPKFGKFLPKDFEKSDLALMEREYIEAAEAVSYAEIGYRYGMWQQPWAFYCTKNKWKAKRDKYLLEIAAGKHGVNETLNNRAARVVGAKAITKKIQQESAYKEMTRAEYVETTRQERIEQLRRAREVLSRTLNISDEDFAMFEQTPTEYIRRYQDLLLDKPRAEMFNKALSSLIEVCKMERLEQGLSTSNPAGGTGGLGFLEQEQEQEGLSLELFTIKEKKVLPEGRDLAGFLD